MLIAECLKQLEDDDSLFPPSDPGWYRHLFLGLLAPTAAEFVANPLTVVTFNYDRSLEAYLHQSLTHRYKISSDNAAEMLRRMTIIHLHGILGQDPQVPYQSKLESDTLKEISNGIKIIHELGDAKDGFCTPEFELANQTLQNAERIFFLGFGFHDDNVRRFRFFTKDSLKDRNVRATVRTTGPLEMHALLQRLADYGITEAAHCGCNDFFTNVVRLD